MVEVLILAELIRIVAPAVERSQATECSSSCLIEAVEAWRYSVGLSHYV